MSVKAEFQLKKKESIKFQETHEELQKELQTKTEQSERAKEIARKSALSNKQKAENIKKSQKIVIEAMQNLQKDQIYLQKMSVKQI